MSMNTRPIVGKNYRITKFKKGPQFGTVDLQVELIPRHPPTPEKFQRKARIRRVNQDFFQRRLTEIRWAAAREQIERDYVERG